MERTTTPQRNQPDYSKPAWYCLRSQPKHEHIAAAHLRLLEGVQVFCPRIRFKRATRQGLVSVMEAMFPGYLFARFELAQMHRRVQYAHGVSGIVQFADRYPTIEEAAIAQLRSHTDATEVKELSYQLSEGDNVQIIGGAFVGQAMARNPWTQTTQGLDYTTDCAHTYWPVRMGSGLAS